MYKDDKLNGYINGISLFISGVFKNNTLLMEFCLAVAYAHLKNLEIYHLRDFHEEKKLDMQLAILVNEKILIDGFLLEVPVLGYIGKWKVSEGSEYDRFNVSLE